ncbi:hypothetical protein EJ110_NYTH01580 [Nymphaea thermarum]|nr:hypothetical protein EJ110_NYTH01580 [Nymphaea thermarum]
MAVASAARVLGLALSASHSDCLFHRPSLSFSRDLRPAAPASPRPIDGCCRKRNLNSPSSLNCLFPGVDGGFWETAGGGDADGTGEDGEDCVSTRRVRFHREFAVLANILKRIEPLDTSVIGEGVSSAAKESMKRTISTMLGLLPSDQFAVTVKVPQQPMARLLSSSIITGYTLWNAEYRVSLMRNFNIPLERELEVSPNDPKFLDNLNDLQNDVVGVHTGEEVMGECELGLRTIGNLSQEALSYIQELESALATVEEELDAEKKQTAIIEKNGECNDLLDYLRSLEPEMVTELSRPSSPEVEEIIQQLVENILQRFFKDENSSDSLEATEAMKSYVEEEVRHGTSMGTSRDYLAKLIFWCMLLGHHMRGLEYRLHLSCVVGIL